MAEQAFRVLKAPCQRCGTYHDCSTCPTRSSCSEPRAAAARGDLTMTPAERGAVANGWNLETFRAAVALGPDGLKALFDAGTTAASPSPDALTAAIRRARGAETPAERTDRLTGSFKAACSPISAAPVEPRVAQGAAPAPPDLTAAIRAARGRT